MDEIKKFKRFCICCCKPLKDKYRLMKTERLTVVGGAFVTATYLSVAGLCEVRFLLLTLFSSSKRASGLSSPLQPSPRLVAPSPARKKSITIERHSMRD